jgi:hypothetical protein
VGDVVAFVWEGWWVRDSVTPTAGGDGDAAGGEQSGRAVVVVDLMVKAPKPRMPKGLGSKGQGGGGACNRNSSERRCGPQPACKPRLQKNLLLLVVTMIGRGCSQSGCRLVRESQAVKLF